MSRFVDVALNVSDKKNQTRTAEPIIWQLETRKSSNKLDKAPFRLLPNRRKTQRHQYSHVYATHWNYLDDRMNRKSINSLINRKRITYMLDFRSHLLTC